MAKTRHLWLAVLVILFAIVFVFGSVSASASSFNNADQLSKEQQAVEKILIEDTLARISKRPASPRYAAPSMTSPIYGYQNISSENKFELICPDANCSINRSLLDVKFEGLNNGYSQLYSFVGLTPLDTLSLVHYLPLGNNSFCMSSADMVLNYGFITGYSTIGSDGKGIICAYDIERLNRVLPFNAQNAGRIQDQSLAVHEMTHILFFGRSSTSYNVQESFASAIARKISGMWDGAGQNDSNFPIPGDPCLGSSNITSFGLVARLCRENGLGWSHFNSIFTKMDEKYRQTGIPVSDTDFKRIIDSVVGSDTTQAFVESGIQICIPNWTLSPSWTSCNVQNIQYKNYYDSNGCGYASPAPKPINQSCNYCSQNIVGPSYTSWSYCSEQNNATRVKFYRDLNYASCCAVTNLSSDCEINTLPYQNTTEISFNCTNYYPQLRINSPTNQIYKTKSVLFNVTSKNLLSKIVYSDNMAKESTLCTNCYGYSGLKSLDEGNHTIKFRGISLDGTNVTNQTSFFIDSVFPKISSTKPKKHKYTNGSDFYIKYSEANCKEMKILVYGQNINSTFVNSCTSGTSIERIVPLDLSLFNGQNVSYKVVITDIAGNVKESSVTEVNVDTTAPSIKNLTTNISGKYVSFNMTVLNENDDSFDAVEYMDNSQASPSWKTLCTSLSSGNVCYKKVSFSYGSHNLTIRALDNSGNSNLETKNFVIV